MPSSGPGPDYQVPSFDVIRPVTNIDAGYVSAVREAVNDAAGLTPARMAIQGIQYPGAVEPRLNLLDAGEIADYHTQNGLLLQRPAIGLLKDHLYKSIPEVMHQPVSMAVADRSVRWMYTPERQGVAFVEFTLGARAATERRLVQRLVRGYLERQTEDGGAVNALPAQWPDRYPIVRLPVARIAGDIRRVEVGRKVVDAALRYRPGIFPDSLEAGPVHMPRRGVYRKRP